MLPDRRETPVDQETPEMLDLQEKMEQWDPQDDKETKEQREIEV